MAFPFHGKIKFIKIPAFLICVILLALYGAGFWIPLRGDWVDGVTSRILSRRLGLQVRCVNAQLVRWSEISFDKIDVGFDSNRQWFESGPGEIYFYAAPFLLFRLTELRLAQTVSASRSLFSMPIFKSLQTEWVIHRLTAGWSGDRSDGFLRLFECASDDFELKGGAKWAHGRIMKAHLYFSISPERSRRLPADIFTRMIPTPKGWVAVRIVYSQNQLMMSGLKGPFFQAQWQA
mgnify:CR=1 FL=1